MVFGNGPTGNEIVAGVRRLIQQRDEYRMKLEQCQRDLEKRRNLEKRIATLSARVDKIADIIDQIRRIIGGQQWPRAMI